MMIPKFSGPKIIAIVLIILLAISFLVYRCTTASVRSKEKEARSWLEQANKAERTADTIKIKIQMHYENIQNAEAKRSLINRSIDKLKPDGLQRAVDSTFNYAKP